MLAKARELPADEVILDLEDSVVPERKDEARATAVAAIGDGSWDGRAVAVRVNPLESDWGREDVTQVVEGAGDELTMAPDHWGDQQVHGTVMRT